MMRLMCILALALLFAGSVAPAYRLEELKASCALKYPIARIA